MGAEVRPRGLQGHQRRLSPQQYRRRRVAVQGRRARRVRDRQARLALFAQIDGLQAHRAVPRTGCQLGRDGADDPRVKAADIRAQSVRLYGRSDRRLRGGGGKGDPRRRGKGYGRAVQDQRRAVWRPRHVDTLHRRRLRQVCREGAAPRSPLRRDRHGSAVVRQGLVGRGVEDRGHALSVRRAVRQIVVGRSALRVDQLIHDGASADGD